MGYQPPRKVYSVEFERHPGLEMSCYGASIGELLDTSDLKFRVNVSPEEQRKLFEFFQSRLVTWNVEHPECPLDNDGNCARCGMKPGNMLPTTVEGMFCLDISFVMDLIMGWMTAVVQVSLPKGMNSLSGAPNIPEEVMSQLASLQSLPTLPEPK